MARKKVQPCKHCGKPIDFPEPRPGAVRVSRPKFCSDYCRLFSKVDKTPGHGPNGDCWPYTGAKHKFGYGMINRGGKNGEIVTTHTMAWEIVNGRPVPDGMFVCHDCDYPPCCNDAHFFLGTHLDNMDDMVAKERQARGEAGGLAKLTEGQALAIRADPRSQRKIAADYGISHALVGKIKSGRLWRHLA